jgi:group I intron endonuclease
MIVTFNALEKKPKTKQVGIYRITSPSGRVYIGQSWNIKQRWFTYRSYAAHKQPLLQASLSKYGAHAHSYEVLMFLPATVEQRVMDKAEMFFIALFRECGIRMLNLMSGGFGGKHSEETKKKIGEKSKGHPPTSTSFKKGESRPRTESWNRNISRGLMGKKVSDATKKKLSEINTGEKHPQYGLTKSEETRRKIGMAHKGRKLSTEQRLAMSRSGLASYSTGKRLKCFGDSSYFHKLTSEQVRKIKRDYIPRVVSAQCLAARYGVSYATIGKIIRGETWIGV